jgi:hypothetical protein
VPQAAAELADKQAWNFGCPSSEQFSSESTRSGLQRASAGHGRAGTGAAPSPAQILIAGSRTYCVEVQMHLQTGP